jgi:hypothetical protein
VLIVTPPTKRFPQFLKTDISLPLSKEALIGLQPMPKEAKLWDHAVFPGHNSILYAPVPPRSPK